MCDNGCADCSCHSSPPLLLEQLTETDLEQIWRAAYPGRERPTSAGLFVRDLCAALHRSSDLDGLAKRSAT